MERRGLPDGPGVYTVVEEHGRRAASTPPHGGRAIPASGSRHLVRSEVESVDFGLRQIVPAFHVALLPRLRELRWGVDQFLDLYICTDNQRNRLYCNRGDGTLEEIAAKAGVQGSGKGCKGAAWTMTTMAIRTCS
jgi:hypothetical protein